MDGLSYTSTSRLRALLCPIGRIRRTRFLEFVDRVHVENIVRLGDVSPDAKPNRTMFSPQGFPNGQIVYNLTTTHDRDHEYLEPFEPHRRTFLVIAIADFTENNPSEILLSQFEDLRAIYRRALFHTCLIFDSPSSAPLPVPKIRPNDDRDTSKYFIPVPTKRESRTTSMRTIMCDITSCLLSEFTGYARTLQSLPTVESPLASGVVEEVGLASPATNNRMSVQSITGASVMGGLQQQRMSMQGFGSGTVTERARSKGKGRVQIAIAELYMLTGRIPDALKEFVEGANIARNNNDHLWHGKALNGIGVCLVILAYLGVDFQIPNIPYPTLDAKLASKSTPTPPKTPTPGPDSIPSRQSTSAADPQQLLELIPELGTTILNLYNRSSNFQGETIPQICFSESVIRHSKFMASVYLANGLSTKSLTNIVLGDPITKPEIIERKIPGLPDKREISASVMRAYPNPIEALTVLDASKVLGGIASVLGSIGFQRRKAMITRELIRILIPGLIQARVVGAAGAGIHPAAGLSATSRPVGPVTGGSGGALDIMEDEVEIGIMGLLEDMCSAYGIVRKHNKNMTASEPIDEERQPGEEIVSENELRAFGWTGLKIHVLRSCMSLCEALPDFNGVLKFTAQLLKMGGSDLPRDEQIKLATNISRTISAAGKLGMDGVVTSYWDAFLLREIELVESNLWKPPMPHARHELQDEDSADIRVPIITNKNPFIYNPFAKKRETVTAEQVLVQGELAEFRVTLQNPFEFDVEIESIALDVKGVEFTTEKQGVVLSPFRTQQLPIFGKPTGSGNMTVVGCRIKVFGCAEKSFPIFTEGFDYGKLDIKIKRMGLPVLEQKPVRPVSAVLNAKRASAKLFPSQFPTPKTIPVTVIENQPLVLAHSSSLPQSALMVLEGERKVFNVVFQNLTDVPVDILFFSFQDSTTTQLQAALASKDMQPSEIYEYEVLLLKKQALLWKNQTQKPKPLPSTDVESEKKEPAVVSLIAPHSTASFDIEVLGKPGLTNASVQMDYGYLGMPRDQVTGRFYTRQVVFPVTITVNASIELLRVDFIPFQTSVDFPEADGVSTSCDTINDKSEQIKKLFCQAKVRDEPSEYCLMTLDLRNAWPQPLKVNLQVRAPPKSPEEEEAEWVNPYETSDTIQAGHQSRFVVLIKRVHLPNPTAKIPSLSGTQRQFVVSTTKPTADQERLSREAFWFREEILKCIRGAWEEIGTQRRGEVELRNFRLSPRMVETVRVDDVGIRMEVIPCPHGKNMESEGQEELAPALLQKCTPSKFILETDQFYNLRTTITNRTTRSILPILRLSPSLRNQHVSVALDLSRRFAFDGLLQQAIRRISPGESTSVEMGFVVLCRGELEVTAGVEEVRAGRWGMDVGGAGGYMTARGEADAGKQVKKLGPDGIPEDILEGVVGKRSWVGREVMTMVVRDKV